MNKLFYNFIFAWKLLEFNFLPLIAAGIGAAASIFSAKKAASATADANQAQVASAREQMRFQADQVKQQMDFQREMSNTAHQRQIADLRAAGLNPILSAKYGGASTPSGSAASGAQANIQSEAPAWTSMGQQLSNIATSAGQQYIQNQKTEAEIKQINQNVKNLKATEGLTEAQTNQVGAMIGKLYAERDNLLAQYDGLRMKNATEGEITDFLLENPTLLQIQATSRAIGVDVSDILDLLPSFKSLSNAWKSIFKKR